VIIVISKGDIVVGVIIGVIVFVAVATIFLLFVNGSLVAPLAVLLAAIVGSILGFLGSILSVTWLEPLRRDQEKKTLSQDTRKALYNQMMHLYILAREAPQKLIEDPERYLSYDAYTSAHANPIFFYSALREAEVFDLTYSKLQEVKMAILQIKADYGASRPRKETISSLVAGPAEVERGGTIKGLLQRTIRDVSELRAKSVLALSSSEIGAHSTYGPSIQRTLAEGGGESVSQRRLKQEIKNATDYIEFLIIYGYFDIDLIKQVCNTTRTEQQTIKRLEELISEKDRPYEERMQDLLEQEASGQGWRRAG
jgi:hypothetical protein